MVCCRGPAGCSRRLPIPSTIDHKTHDNKNQPTTHQPNKSLNLLPTPRLSQSYQTETYPSLSFIHSCNSHFAASFIIFHHLPISPKFPHSRITTLQTISIHRNLPPSLLPSFLPSFTFAAGFREMMAYSELDLTYASKMLMFVLIFLQIISTFSQLATELCLAMVKRDDAIELRCNF
jgi:hypothetical protein